MAVLAPGTAKKESGVEPPQSKEAAADILPTIRDGQRKKAVRKHRTPKRSLGHADTPTTCSLLDNRPNATNVNFRKRDTALQRFGSEER
jgi:hypothetical protein